jgi:hypothetical protein
MNPIDVHELAQAMGNALPGAWTEIKGTPFPGDPSNPDQQVLFLAIARGLLQYLHDRQSNAIVQMELRPPGSTNPGSTFAIVNLQLNISGAA